MVTAEEIWSAAVAAQRINGEYLQENDHWSSASPRISNKHLIKSWLFNNQIPATTDDIENGKLCRDHFKTYLLLELSGSITAFQRLALKLAHLESLDSSNLFELSVIACLPSVQEMDKFRESANIAYHVAVQGTIGEAIKGDILIVSSVFNPNYSKYRITALLGNRLVEFWCRSHLVGEYFIEAKIKSVNADFSTQLNHIKRLTSS